ncbi:pyridoxamine 5'-phosphate oxidase family protein [Marinobacter mobilis]|uniref:pyridoxamine 5'-phosphate oxidase family protein n=1 Tax=Marinobacter mobilis TaxID=488533 RepID=UPI0035C6F07E
MAHKFAELTFTRTVKRVQEEMGSRSDYLPHESGPERNKLLRDRERSFIEARDSFYVASVSETGWPYIQHRGGPAGFLKVMDPSTIGFADYSGNRQYVTTGNVLANDRVALFLMDYPNRRRLKLLGHMALAGPEQLSILEQLHDHDYGAVIERGMIIRVEAFDWNCPQHITPRYTLLESEALCASREP